MSIVGSEQWMYASGEEVTQQSLKFNDDESQYLSWTPAAAGNRKTWTWSGWVKRGNIVNTRLFNAGASSASKTEMTLFGSGALWFEGAGSNTCYFQTAALFRDVSAWYHFVVAVDTTQSTSSDRVKIYVNSEQITAFDTYETYPAQNSDFVINSTTEHTLGKRSYSADYSDMYLSDVYFIDGQALDPTSFGQFTNGYWEAKDYAGTYGTNGFHLTFQDDVVSEGFNAVTYRGTGADQSISGLGFSPDFVWLKGRNYAEHHHLYDTIRGATEVLYSNRTVAEASDTLGLTSFNPDGFSIGSRHEINNSGNTFVGWAWDAGSGSPVSNTDGSITSTVKANPSYGFSIGTFTKGSGTETFGHGLTSAPELLILKRRDSTGSWFSYSSVTGADKWIRLNGTDAATTDSTFWNNTAPTSSVATISTAYNSGEQLVFYAFNSVAGYSSIGSYSGTGSSVTVNCGFRPAFVMIKATNLVEGWAIIDSTRDTINPRNKVLKPNSSNAEASGSQFNTDFTDTGFVMNGTDGVVNASGGTYIYMAFKDTREAAFWKDVSGQGNHWTPNNLDYRDSLPDSPANNFATFNALNLPASAVLSEGNLKFTQTANDRAAAGNMSISSGKWYFEVRYTAGTNPETGLAPINQSYANSGATSSTGKLLLITNSTGMRTPAWSTTDTTGISAQTSTTILGFAVDADNGKMFISANGTYFNSGDPAAGTNPQATFDSDWLEQTGGGVVPFSGIYTGTSGEVIINFGQDSTFSGAKPMGEYTDDSELGTFQHQPPAGFKSLCTANLPDPTIVDGSEYFNTVLYTGTGATQSITGVGFGSAPDFVWIKTRSAADNHVLNDTVRGGNRQLFSNSTDQEFTSTTLLQTFDSDGFTLGTDSAVNGSGRTFVSWSWKAGGTAVSNTDGSITSQVSANVDAGFSIVSYTGNGTGGSTVGHGLSGVDAVIVKRRDSNAHWQYLDKNLASGDVLLLSSTNAATAYSNFSGGAIDNLGATTFSLENGSSNCDNVNANGGTYIAYCFANSDTTKVGSYTGNGSSDGPFVYTGFRPAWVMFKSATSAESWNIVDSERNVYNVIDNRLYADSSAAESAGVALLDFTSNGFKLRATWGSINASGQTFIYLAFAETPFKYANAR